MNGDFLHKRQSAWSRLKPFYFALMVVALVFVSWRTYAPNLVWSSLSLIFFLALALLSVRSPRLGLRALLVMLPMSPVMHVQLNAIFHAHWQALHNPGLDLVAGFILGTSVRLALEKGFWRYLQLFSPMPFWAHAYLVLSVALAISRNVWQSASRLTKSGLTLNASTLRQLSWQDDYFPLKDLYAYSLAFMLLIAVAYLVKRKAIKMQLFYPLLCGCALTAAFGWGQYLTQRGFARDGFNMGVNSFFPDLHSFAGILLLPALITGLVTRGYSLKVRVIGALVQLMCLGAIFISGSRFTIITSCLALLAGALWQQRRKPWRLLAASGLALVLITGGVLYVQAHGLRGLTWPVLVAAWNDPQFERINAVLANRPALFKAAWSMFSHFPYAGVGQGAFNRLTAFPELVQVDFFQKHGTENAHNYFLQTLAELGVFGFLLMALVIVLPLWRRRRDPFIAILGAAIGALALGNIYAHSWLEREALMITAAFVGGLYVTGGRRRYAQGKKVEGVGRFWRAIRTLGFVCLLGLAGHEVWNSFHTYPFIYGIRCFVARPLTHDGWTSGLYRYPLAAKAMGVKLSIEPAHVDVKRRPLAVSYLIENEQGQALVAEHRTYDREDQDHILLRLSNEQFQTPGTKYFVIQVSRCLVPRNVGTSYDPRLLGIHVSAAGSLF